MKRWCIACIAAILFPAAMAQGLPASIFGISLGGKPPARYPICKEIGTREKNPCAIEPPSRVKRWTTWHITLPDRVLPKWAAFSTSEIVAGGGLIESITVQTHGEYCPVAEMRGSIAQRFGTPSEETGSNLQSIVWQLPDVVIRITSAPEIKHCKVAFHTRSSIERDLRAAAKLHDGRPSSP